jgi:putative membrane protein
MRPFVLRSLGVSLVVALILKTMGTSESGWPALIGAALFLGLLNGLVRPLVLRAGLPAIVVTTGLIVIILNVVFFVGLRGSIPAYEVQPLPSALVAAGITSLVSWPLNLFFRGSDGHVHPVTYHGSPASSEKLES